MLNTQAIDKEIFAVSNFCQSDQNLKILMSEKSAMRTFVLQSEILHMMEKILEVKL